MKHIAIEQVLERAEKAKSDSDYTYFFTLLLAGEALLKVVTLGLIAAIEDDKDRNRYRLEYQLVKSDGIGEWASVIEDTLNGPASQYIVQDARIEQTELTRLCKEGEWQYEAVISLKLAMASLKIEVEEIQVKTDMKRWFRLFSNLRNKTRGHGATKPEKTTDAARYLYKSINLIYSNFYLFKREWVYLHRNLSGKYRVSNVSDVQTSFEYLKQSKEFNYPNGVYIDFLGARRVNLMMSDSELQDFYFSNGSFKSKIYEMLSYYSDNKKDGDASDYIIPPGTLPKSETEGHGELLVCENCFSNAPEIAKDYIDRTNLENELALLLNDDKRPIITLIGRGGIGKTSLALKAIRQLYHEKRFNLIVWLSARDVDLSFTGPKSVRPAVLTPEDMGKYYADLVLSHRDINEKGFNAKTYFEKQLGNNDLGACLYVFDNFETTQNPIEMFKWIDTYIRLPNKALITTRLREFKGDYPVDVAGMDDNEARKLIAQTANSLQINEKLNQDYINSIVSHSEGHPYVIKILLGEVAKNGKAGNLTHIIAGTEDILIALFERTYASLSPCAQRAFLTLSAWNSFVPRLALEAVLIKSTEERNEVEKGIEMLIQYSLAIIHTAHIDGQDFISLPLVANIFGKKKLNINTARPLILADVAILQMFGATQSNDVQFGLGKRVEKMIGILSSKIEGGDDYSKYAPILEAICRSYNPGWLLLSRMHMEERTESGYSRAKEELRRFLENSASESTSEAWRLLAYACYQTKDYLGEIHAFVERAQVVHLPFHDLSNTVNKLNQFIHERSIEIEKEQKRDLAHRLISVIDDRLEEANATDLSRMAWLSIYLGEDERAEEYVKKGYQIEPDNYYIMKLMTHYNH